jgi:hypothetical protein
MKKMSDIKYTAAVVKQREVYYFRFDKVAVDLLGINQGDMVSVAINEKGGKFEFVSKKNDGLLAKLDNIKKGEGTPLTKSDASELIKLLK